MPSPRAGRSPPPAPGSIARRGSTGAGAVPAVRGGMLTGRYIHNVPMTNNSIEGNCSGPAWNAGPEKQSAGVLMQRKGYMTAFAGKYLNRYGIPLEQLVKVSVFPGEVVGLLLKIVHISTIVEENPLHSFGLNNKT